MSDAAARPRVIIVMGVAGAGKTLVGSTFAKALGWSFYDADDFHSPENVAKMHHGIGLTDADLRALYRYLHSLPPVRRDNGPTMQKEKGSVAGD